MRPQQLSRDGEVTDLRHGRHARSPLPITATAAEHGPLADERTGTARERTPWHATQWAAWEALKKAEDER